MTLDDFLESRIKWISEEYERVMVRKFLTRHNRDKMLSNLENRISEIQNVRRFLNIQRINLERHKND